MEEILVKRCKALGDESRLRILGLLLHRSYCVKALAQKIQISPSAVSQHLRVLKEANLVTADKQGYWVHYGINEKGVKDFLQEIETFFSQKKKEGGCCSTTSP